MAVINRASLLGAPLERSLDQHASMPRIATISLTLGFVSEKAQRVLT